MNLFKRVVIGVVGGSSRSNSRSRSKPMVTPLVVIISLLVVMLICSATLTFVDDLSALMKQVTKMTCGPLTEAQDPDYSGSCCWTERDDGTGGGTEGDEQIVCCYTRRDNGQVDCKTAPTSGPPLQPDLPTLETVPPNRTLPGVDDLPTLEQVPPRTLPGGDLPTLEQVPTEGEPPLPVVCSEEAGLELDEETGQCVPIESPVTEEQPEEAPEEEPEEEEQPEPEEEQPSEESDSEDNGNN